MIVSPYWFRYEDGLLHHTLLHEDEQGRLISTCDYLGEFAPMNRYEKAVCGKINRYVTDRVTNTAITTPYVDDPEPQPKAQCCEKCYRVGLMQELGE